MLTIYRMMHYFLFFLFFFENSNYNLQNYNSYHIFGTKWSVVETKKTLIWIVHNFVFRQFVCTHVTLSLTQWQEIKTLRRSASHTTHNIFNLKQTAMMVTANHFVFWKFILYFPFDCTQYMPWKPASILQWQNTKGRPGTALRGVILKL